MAQATALSASEATPVWQALKQWAEELEKDWVIGNLSKLSANDPPAAWERSTAQSRGMMIALKLLLKLPEDARATIEEGTRKLAASATPTPATPDLRDDSGLVRGVFGR